MQTPQQCYSEACAPNIETVKVAPAPTCTTDTSEPTGIRGFTPVELPWAGSKAEAESVAGHRLLAADPEAAGRVAEVMRALDAKDYSGSAAADRVSFWRAVGQDLVQKVPEGFTADEGLLVADLSRVVTQMAKFRAALPRVRTFYAVKCNNHPAMLQMLSALGSSFDCASQREFETVLDSGYVASPDDIIYANPCKMISSLKAAKARGVTAMTFDNEEELVKIADHFPSARVVLRIKTDDSHAVCQLSSKFGADMRSAYALLERAAELKLDLAGVAFHVGSGNSDTEAYAKALRDARALFDAGAALGFNMRILDIGGGFPGSDPRPGSGGLAFEQIAAGIRPVLDALFPVDSGVDVIAEPGRFFAEQTFAIAMPIHSRRRMKNEDGVDTVQLYTTDGVYGSFNCLIFDHQHPEVHVLHPDAEAAERVTTIFGPTCDGIDFILKAQPFPELDIGEWIFVPDFGAYTIAARSSFNGFETRRIEYVTSMTPY